MARDDQPTGRIEITTTSDQTRVFLEPDGRTTTEPHAPLDITTGADLARGLRRFADAAGREYTEPIGAVEPEK